MFSSGNSVTVYIDDILILSYAVEENSCKLYISAFLFRQYAFRKIRHQHIDGQIGKFKDGIQTISKADINRVQNSRVRHWNIFNMYL